MVLIITENTNATYEINFGQVFNNNLDEFMVVVGEQLIQEGVQLLENIFKDIGLKGQQITVIISRIACPETVLALEWLQKRGCGVFFHVDDWFFDFPKEIKAAYAERYNSDYLNNLEKMIIGSDAVLTSTPMLRKLIENRFPGVRVFQSQGVVSNVFRLTVFDLKVMFFRLYRFFAKRSKFVIGYAGTSSHTRDLNLVLPALEEILINYRFVEIEFLGLDAPESLIRLAPDRVRSFGYSASYKSYLNNLFSLGWDLGLCPLVDDLFNRAKTPTKLIEYTQCGIPALCSNLEPYSEIQHYKGAVLVNNGDWYYYLDQMINNSTIRKDLFNASREMCKTKTSKSARIILNNLLNTVLSA
jgi:glycosyltransferase involved in cell wall biosynthesis